MFGTVKLLLLVFLFYNSIVCRIDVANLIDSVDYHKRSFKIDKDKKQVDGKGKEKLRSMTTSSGDGSQLANSPFSKIRWNEEIAQAIEVEPETYNLDRSPVREANKKFGLPNVVEKCIRKGDIALTFDDGVSKVTKNVLDILRSENVKATFFIIGSTYIPPF